MYMYMYEYIYIYICIHVHINVGTPARSGLMTCGAQLRVAGAWFKGNEGGPKEWGWNIGQCEGSNVHRAVAYDPQSSNPQDPLSSL